MEKKAKVVTLALIPRPTCKGGKAVLCADKRQLRVLFQEGGHLGDARQQVSKEACVYTALALIRETHLVAKFRVRVEASADGRALT